MRTVANRSDGPVSAVWTQPCVSPEPAMPPRSARNTRESHPPGEGTRAGRRDQPGAGTRAPLRPTWVRATTSRSINCPICPTCQRDSACSCTRTGRPIRSRSRTRAIRAAMRYSLTRVSTSTRLFRPPRRGASETVDARVRSDAMQRLPARRVTRWMYFAVIIASATTASSAQEQTPRTSAPSSEAEVEVRGHVGQEERPARTGLPSVPIAGADASAWDR